MAQFFSRMKRALVVIAWILSLRLIVHAADQPLLKVHIAAKEPAAGLHAADFSRFPNLGYISDKPDFTISQLEGVAFGVRPGRQKPDGGYSSPTEDRRSLELRLTAKDAEALKKLTSAHVGSRLLLMFNNQPLMAPDIKTPMTGQSMYITYLPRDLNAAELKTKLETLVQKPKESQPSATPLPKSAT
jgi:preprotein translocase subunit SecD